MSSGLQLALLACLICAVTVAAAPYQELAPRKGHIPVYIREGDTPLSHIHPKLAEAFHEIDPVSLISEDSSVTNEDDKTDVKVDTAISATENASQNKPTTESDIASFDEVKGGESDDTKADVLEEKLTENKSTSSE